MENFVFQGIVAARPAQLRSGRRTAIAVTISQAVPSSQPAATSLG